MKWKKMEFLWYYRNGIKDFNNLYRMYWLQKLKFVLISKKVSKKIAYIRITIFESSQVERQQRYLKSARQEK